jgi:hypothetical protein
LENEPLLDNNIDVLELLLHLFDLFADLSHELGTHHSSNGHLIVFKLHNELVDLSNKEFVLKVTVRHDLEAILVPSLNDTSEGLFNLFLTAGGTRDVINRVDEVSGAHVEEPLKGHAVHGGGGYFLKEVEHLGPMAGFHGTHTESSNEILIFGHFSDLFGQLIEDIITSSLRNLHGSDVLALLVVLLDLGDGSLAVLFTEVSIEPGLTVLAELIAAVPKVESQVISLLELGELIKLEDLLDSEDLFVSTERLNLFESHLVFFLDLRKF